MSKTGFFPRMFNSFIIFGWTELERGVAEANMYNREYNLSFKKLVR